MGRISGVLRYGLEIRPSDLIRSQVFRQFWYEQAGIDLRHQIGIDNIMWNRIIRTLLRRIPSRGASSNARWLACRRISAGDCSTRTRRRSTAWSEFDLHYDCRDYHGTPRHGCSCPFERLRQRQNKLRPNPESLLCSNDQIAAMPEHEQHGFISVVDYVVEDADLWARRLTNSRWGDRVPHLERASDGFGLLGDRWAARSAVEGRSDRRADGGSR